MLRNLYYMKNTYQKNERVYSLGYLSPWLSMEVFLQQIHLFLHAGLPVRISCLWDTKTWQNVLSFTGHSDGVETVQLQTYDATKLTGLVLSGCKLSNTGTLQGRYNYDETFLVIDIIYNALHCFIVEGKPSRP